MASSSDDEANEEPPWLNRGVAEIGGASLLADLGHEVPTALLPSFLTVTLGAPAAALGLIEGSLMPRPGLRGWPEGRSPMIRFDAEKWQSAATRRRRSSPRRSASRELPCRSASSAPEPGWREGSAFLLGTRSWPTSSRQAPTAGPTASNGRWTTSVRSAGPCWRSHSSPSSAYHTAIVLSVIPGLLATLSIIYAIRATPRTREQERQPLRLRLRPVFRGRLGRLFIGISAFEIGNVAATLLILRATEALVPAHGQDDRYQDRTRSLRHLQRRRHGCEHSRRAPRRPARQQSACPRTRRRLLRARLPRPRPCGFCDRRPRTLVHPRRDRHRLGRDRRARHRRHSR